MKNFFDLRLIFGELSKVVGLGSHVVLSPAIVDIEKEQPLEGSSAVCRLGFGQILLQAGEDLCRP